MPLFTPAFSQQFIENLKRKGDVKSLIQALEFKGDWKIHSDAARALGDLKDLRAVEPLCRLLTAGKNTEERVMAAAALGKIGGEAAVEPLRAAALKDEDPTVRRLAAESLNQLGWAPGPSSAGEDILLVAGDEQKIAIIRSLSDGGDPAKISVLIDVLKGSYSAEVGQALEDALAGCGQAAVAPVCTFLMGNPDSPVQRFTAIRALEKMADPEAVEALFSLLESEHPDLVNSAIFALARRGEKRAAGAFAGILQSHPQPRERGAAAGALGMLGEEQAVRPLIGALRDAEWVVQTDAAKSLGLLGDPEAVGPLIETLRDAEKVVTRTAAAEALGRIGGEEAVDALYDALQQPEGPEREAIARALVGRGLPQPFATEIQPYRSDSVETQTAKLIRSNLLRDFCVRRNGEWNHEDWLGLLARVRLARFTKMTDGEIGACLENEKRLFKQRMEAAAALIDCIGLRIGTDLLKYYLAILGEPDLRQEVVTSRSLDYPGLGLTLEVNNPSGRLSGITFHNQSDKPGWNPFPASLPGGISFDRPPVMDKYRDYKHAPEITPADHFAAIKIIVDSSETLPCKSIRFSGFYEPYERDSRFSEATSRINHRYAKKYLAGELTCSWCKQIILESDGTSIFKFQIQDDGDLRCQKCTDRHYSND